MKAAEIHTNNKAITVLRSLQMLNRLASQAFANAMSYHDGCGNVNANAEAQSAYRESEFVGAVRVQAAYWKMDVNELMALAMGEHSLQTENN